MVACVFEEETTTPIRVPLVGRGWDRFRAREQKKDAAAQWREKWKRHRPSQYEQPEKLKVRPIDDLRIVEDPGYVVHSPQNVDGPVRSPVRSSSTDAVSGGSTEAFPTITTQATATPSETTISLGASQNGLMIYIANSFSIEDNPEARVLLYIDDGNGVQSLDLIWGQAYCYKSTDYGATLKIGSTYLDETGCVLSLQVAPLEVPVNFIKPADYASPVSGVCNTDGNYPLEWEPTTTRVTLARENEWLAFDLSAGGPFGAQDVQGILYVRERRNEDEDWGPWRAVIYRPNSITHFFCRYRYVAIAQTQKNGAAPISACPGSVIDEVTASDNLSWASEFTVVRTVNVADANELATAIADLQSGDKLVLAAGTYATASMLLSLTTDVWIAGATGDPANVIFGNLDMEIDCDVVGRKFFLSGIAIDSHGSNWVRINRGQIRIWDCNFTKSAGTGTDDVIYFDAYGTDATYKCAWCNAVGHTTAAFDVWSNTSSSTVDHGETLLIGCTGSTPGDTGRGVSGPDPGATNCNLLTQHQGHKMLVWGGLYSNPANISGAGPSIAPDVDGNMWMIGVSVNDGSTSNAVRYGSGSASISLSYACDVADIGDAASCWSCYNSIGNRYICGGASTNFFSDNYTGLTQRLIGDTWVNTGGVGYGAYLAGSSYEIVGCSFTGFQRGWYITGSNSAESPQRIMCCIDDNASATDVGRQTQTGVIELLFNVSRGNITANNDTTKNALVDGNLNTNSGVIASGLTNPSQRSTITPLLNSSAAAATNQDSDGTPQSTSNLDWTTYASGLSEANKTTLRSRIGRDLGLMGVKGDALLIDAAIVCRGPRQRALVTSGRGLYQVVL